MLVLACLVERHLAVTRSFPVLVNYVFDFLLVRVTAFLVNLSCSCADGLWGLSVLANRRREAAMGLGDDGMLILIDLSSLRCVLDPSIEARTQKGNAVHSL